MIQAYDPSCSLHLTDCFIHKLEPRGLVAVAVAVVAEVAAVAAAVAAAALQH